ncbi:DUF6049 family protein [Klenkia taihuensis]|uniref:Glycoprotein n=1 Tax=Klenkia taihuensis TaxID=1225127 RepID=A0A1I1GQE7_9ACTN|nr:DUF6049 family protein [Klenkia taihuensis]GHE09593.1 glycoprotein [Klenkia taihuensis]SFC13987.1 hypothetical protein SAMN05661030_0218 [Klenkia taihuensis]
MTRRAAGGAGRPATRVLLGVTVLTAVLGALLLPVPAAQAAPATGATAAAPVAITITTLEPRTVTPGSTVVVGMTLTNDGDDTITDLSVRLQRGDRLTTRDELTADAAQPSAGDAAQAPFQPIPSTVLEPGDDAFFQFSTPAADLALTADGVYPVLVNVNGTRAGLVERVGELSTYLTVFAGTTSRTTVSWLWPLTDRPHRDADGTFTDDDLADEVSADGRLDRALAALEGLPDGGRTVPVTLAVDPALVEELTAMSGGYTVDGAPGGGVAAAGEWLSRLRSLAVVHPVVALPYADVDADALQAAGLPGALTRSLPGTVEGTAAQPARGSAPATPSATATATTEPPAPTTSAGEQVLADALDTTPRTDLAWPAGGAVRTDTLATLTAGGVDQLVLGQGGYTDADAAVGRTGRAAAARVPVTTAGGTLTTLVADSALAEVVAGADTAVGGPRVAEQRYLAELGVLTSQLAAVDPAVAQTVLVVPPREVQADPDWTTPMMADTATEPWLAAASLEDLASGPVADAGDLVAPADDARLAGPGMASVAAAVAVRDDVAGAVVGDPGTVLAGYDAAVSRAVSVSWRDDPDGFTASATDLQQTLAALRGEVGLVAPADGAYSLASSDAPLVLTVRNDLPFAVDVTLDLQTRSGVGFEAETVPAQRLDPLTRTVITVPTSVRQSGSFTVVAQLATPAGGPLGTEVQLRVSSTAYGPITLAITIGATALLGLLFLRRLVLFVLRRRRGGPAPVDDDVLVPVDGDAAGPQSTPPTRSPV